MRKRLQMIGYMTFSKPRKYQLAILLALLNFIIRIPSVPHEMGNDGFTVHIVANSLSASGSAGWLLHPSSIFGLYPYSYGSAVPFILSGISQVTGVEMETATWVYSVIIGLLSAFTAYTLAKNIWDYDTFKFLVAFSYSLSPGILGFSTWDITTRGLFLVLFPLFLYLMLKILKCNTKSDIIKFTLLFFISIVLLMATHRYIFYTFPIIIGSTILWISSKIYINRFFKISPYFIKIAFLAGLLVMLSIPFFTGILIEVSRYEALNILLENSIRYSGVLFIFTVPGLIYLSLKNNKKMEEWFVLLAFLMLMPLMYQQTYIHYFIIILNILFLSIAMINVIEIRNKKKYAIIFVAIMLLISTGYSAFFQCWDFKGRSKYHLDEKNYNTGLWIKKNIGVNKKLIAYDELTGREILSVSEVPTLVGDADDAMLAIGFVNKTEMNVSFNSQFGKKLYKSKPYILNSRNDVYEDYYGLRSYPIYKAGILLNKYNLTYVIINDLIAKNDFTNTIQELKDNIYNNGKILVWRLD
jgi:hypothetical protein